MSKEIIEQAEKDKKTINDILDKSKVLDPYLSNLDGTQYESEKQEIEKEIREGIFVYHLMTLLSENKKFYEKMNVEDTLDNYSKNKVLAFQAEMAMGCNVSCLSDNLKIGKVLGNYPEKVDKDIKLIEIVKHLSLDKNYRVLVSDVYQTYIKPGLNK